jgi:8-oxo-dGTP pyrophosphatase MutT (NUDIX family)
MAQKYKIHINDLEIYLVQYTEPFKLFPTNELPFMVVDLTSTDKLDKLLHSLEIRMVKSNVIISSKDLDKVKERLLGLFNLIVAGGGLVINENDEILMIYRKGKWDLPKGKIEKNEKKRQGAMREVEEETGVKVDLIREKITKTYHTYNLNHKRMLKETHWYLMEAKSDQEFKPQAEEGVEEVRWVSKKDLDSYLPNCYNSIREVLNKHI